MSNLLIIGHRGVPSMAPENTIPSFVLAARSGAQMIELDVQLTKDGRVVAIHDETLARTAKVKGSVASYTFAQLTTIDVGRWFNPEFAGTTIPSLEQIFEALPPKIGLNIELKTQVVDYPGIEKKVLDIVNKYNAEQRVIVSSFNWASLENLHRLKPNLRLGLLFRRATPELWRHANLLNAYSIHPPGKITSASLVWQAHCWGYRVYPWVVNSVSLMLKLQASGVDGVITDYPQTLSRSELC